MVRKEVTKLLDNGIIYSISNSKWVSPFHVVLKKGGLTIVWNESNDLILTRTVTGWRMCIDYRKLNKATRKDHFSLLFIDQVLERLANFSNFYYLDGLSGCSIRFLFIPKIKLRLHLHAHMVLLLLGICLLVYAMHLQLSKDACFQYLVICLMIV